jgi:hypothetical protein
LTFWTVILSADDEKQTRSHRIPTPKTPEPVIPPDGTQSERIAMLAAVGGQESGMGKGAGYNPVTHTGADGHGHGIWRMDDTYNRLPTVKERDAIRILQPTRRRRSYPTRSRKKALNEACSPITWTVTTPPCTTTVTSWTATTA